MSPPGLLAALPSFSDDRRSEVVLDLQRRVGNAVVARLLEDQEAPAPEEVPAVDSTGIADRVGAAIDSVLARPDPDGAAGEAIADSIIAVIERYRARVNPAAIGLLSGVLVPAARDGTVHEVWGPVATVVMEAGLPKSKDVRARLPARLTTPDALEAFRRVIPEDRAGIVDAVFAALLAVRDSTPAAEGGGGREGAPSTAAAEWEQLKPVQKYFPNKKLEDYVLVRTNLLGAFGALQGGSAGALQRILAFYTGEIKIGKLADKEYPVHEHMATALAAADTLFKAKSKGTKSEGFKLTHFGGLVIRPNANNPAVLSEHALGAAIDLDAELNPNERGFPFELIEDVTGDDLRAGASGTGVDLYNVTASGSRPERVVGYDEAFREARRIAKISDEFKTAFQTEEKLGAQMLEIANRKGRPQVGAPELLEAAKSAATEPDPGWAPSAPEPAQAAKGRKRPKAKPAKVAPHHERLAELVFPPDRVDWTADREEIGKTVELLADMYAVFTKTVVPEDPARAADAPAAPDKRKPPPQPRAQGDPENRARVDPKGVDPDLEHLAMHGFMNVPPELAAALIAPDGGNLRWLGAGASGTRDYMHFELRRPPRPATQ